MCNKHALDKFAKGGVYSNIGAMFGGPLGAMTGADIGFRGINPLDIHSQGWSGLNKDVVFAVDPAGLGLGAKVGQLAGGVTGQNKRDRAAAANDDRRAQADLKLRLQGPDAPQESASLLDPNAAVRDSRRRAALLGISQLKIPGPGVATGGGFGGANAPLG